MSESNKTFTIVAPQAAGPGSGVAASPGLRGLLRSPGTHRGGGSAGGPSAGGSSGRTFLSSPPSSRVRVQEPPSREASRGSVREPSRGRLSNGGTPASAGLLQQRPSSVASSVASDKATGGVALDEADAPRMRNLSLWEQSSWRAKLYAVADPGSFPSDVPASTEIAGYLVAAFLFLLIMVNSASVMAETYPEYQLEPIPLYWVAVETTCVVVFTVDLLLRFVTCPSRISFAFDALNYIDVLAVLPFYLEMFVGIEFAPWLRMLRVIRLARIVRVLKTASVMGLDAILTAIQHSITGMFLFVAMAGTALLVFATCIYFAERGEFIDGVWWRPCLRFETHCSANDMREPSPFQSVPDAFWFTIVTMGTVGFSDVTPKTGLGQMVGVLVMLSGVFVIAFPTMILSGHYDAAAKLERVVRRTFEQIRERHLENKNTSSRAKLFKACGWPLEQDQTGSLPRFDAKGNAAPPPAGKMDASLFGTLATSVMMSGSFGGGGAKNDSGKSSRVTFVPPTLPANYNVVALFTFRGVPRELRYSMTNECFYYEPLFHLLRDEAGFPATRVIFGKCGQPTLVQLTLLLDHHEARNTAANIVNGNSAGAAVHFEVGGGFVVRHHSPFDGIAAGHSSKFTMLTAKGRPGYRNSEIAINFERHRTRQEEHRMLPESSYMDAEMVRQEALSALLGTSLFIQTLIPGCSVRKRVTVVTQYFLETRLHRELALIAMNSGDALDEAVAFITKDDAIRLLDGIHKKVDLYDHELCLEHVDQVDMDIADTFLARLRRVRMALVPRRLHHCVLNGDLLGPQDEVHEVPMSLFAADVEDEVEEDSLGYIEVTATPYMGRCIRVDVSLDCLVDDL